MAKKLEELKGKLEIDKAYQEGYESEKIVSYNDVLKESDAVSQRHEKEIVKNNMGKETKSKRLHISIQPKLYEDITKIAFINKISLNEQIARTLQELRDRGQDKIKKYDEI
jgi:predicted HicB family RNase H-like nuclease